MTSIGYIFILYLKYILFYTTAQDMLAANYETRCQFCKVQHI